MARIKDDAAVGSLALLPASCRPGFTTAAVNTGGTSFLPCSAAKIPPRCDWSAAIAPGGSTNTACEPAPGYPRTPTIITVSNWSATLRNRPPGGSTGARPVERKKKWKPTGSGPWASKDSAVTGSNLPLLWSRCLFSRSCTTRPARISTFYYQDSLQVNKKFSLEVIPLSLMGDGRLGAQRRGLRPRNGLSQEWERSPNQ